MSSFEKNKKLIYTQFNTQASTANYEMFWYIFTVNSGPDSAPKLAEFQLKHVVTKLSVIKINGI